ncbi:hypothetical protein PLICRDRAFT_168214 [Plicaturopsis crispa FD-325 SS-3]|uniref:AB hydrolase-1 domain-containing protein n=1 Tax=Plicaturopsis crispa FD-325 SS-3 TaxID=944288 RepID=A0A0C9T478_PLICR|nr:hypothetical protein PLICRDRAFT_168214 [Plicaturopsis crispa FD-325 SS-3]
MSETTGEIPFRVGDETFKTWYKVVGDLKACARPLVVLHGGPGISHEYMLPHADLVHKYDTAVIFYDQIGIGRSTHLASKPAEFWTVELFMAELDNLLAHFGIAGSFDLLGHSWGGMLASTYVLSRKPRGLGHLVLVGTPASLKLWEDSARALLRGLPEEVRETIERCEREGTTESQEYQDAVGVYYEKHACTVQPWPEEVARTFGAAAEDPTVYHTMFGSSEFTVTGTIKDWSVVDEVHAIAHPTLVINSPNDMAQDIAVRPFVDKIPKVKWTQFAKSTHMPHWEESEAYMKVVGDFLTTL